MKRRKADEIVAGMCKELLAFPEGFPCLEWRNGSGYVFVSGERHDVIKAVLEHISGRELSPTRDNMAYYLSMSPLKPYADALWAMAPDVSGGYRWYGQPAFARRGSNIKLLEIV